MTSTRNSGQVPPHARARANPVSTVVLQIQHLRGVAPSAVQTWRGSLICGASSSRGVRKPCGVAGCGVKAWRHLPGIARSGVKMWRQFARCGVKTWRHLPTWHSIFFSSGIARCGASLAYVRTWRHLLTWRQRATWRRRTWRQSVASGAIDLRGVAGRGVNEWRQVAQASPARVFKMCLQSSGDMCAPTGNPPIHWLALVNVDTVVVLQ